MIYFVDNKETGWDSDIPKGKVLPLRLGNGEKNGMEMMKRIMNYIYMGRGEVGLGLNWLLKVSSS